MAMNTMVNTGNVSSVNPANSTVKSNPRIVANDSYSPFQPETQVTLENSVKSMLGTLEKAAFTKGISTQELPEEVRQMVETLMKNAFSLESSLSQGLSDALQSQRFTLDQLKLLSKFLEQIGTLAENQKIDTLPDSLKLLLGNMDMLLGEDGKLLEGMQLNKLAFQLLEGKSLADLPEVLQFLLLNQTAVPGSHIPQSTELNFLKQLVQFFMPQQAEAEETPSGANQSKNPANANNQTAQQQGASSSSQGAKPAPPGTNSTANAAGTGQGNLNAAAAQTPSGERTPATPQDLKPQQNSGMQEQPKGENPAQPSAANRPEGQNAMKAELRQPQPNAKHQEVSQETQKNGGMEQDGVKQNSNLQGKPPLQNTPQTMQTLKSLAAHLLKNNNFTENEVHLLKDFIQGSQKVLNDKEVKQLQTLLRMSEENIPAAVRQAAIQQDLPNLPKLWAFVQLCNLTRLLDLQANRLRKAGKDVNDFATILKKSLHNESEVNGNQRTMSFMTPLYLGDNEKCYPTYVHIYDEFSQNNEDGEEQKETWLRLCMLTEHIGAVELVFRLYEKNNINLRVSFSELETADSFNEYIPELRAAFDELPLILNDVKVRAIGE